MDVVGPAISFLKTIVSCWNTNKKGNNVCHNSDKKPHHDPLAMFSLQGVLKIMHSVQTLIHQRGHEEAGKSKVE